MWCQGNCLMLVPCNGVNGNHPTGNFVATPATRCGTRGFNLLAIGLWPEEVLVTLNVHVVGGPRGSRWYQVDQLRIAVKPATYVFTIVNFDPDQIIDRIQLSGAFAHFVTWSCLPTIIA
jgi:hypothetical protein